MKMIRGYFKENKASFLNSVSLTLNCIINPQFLL